MKKGISLVALVITIVVLVILTGTVVITTINNNMFANTQSAVNEYNKKIIIEDIQTKIQTEKLKKVNQGIYMLTMEEIIPIIQEHGTLDNNILKLTTTKGIEIWLYEIMPIPLEEYATITYENSVLTVQTQLTSNGYILKYTIDAGTNWNTYNQAVTITEESGIMVRLTNEQGQVVSNTIKVTQGGNIVADTTAPTVTITADKTNMTTGEKVTITVTLSEEVTNYNKEDITITKPNGATVNVTDVSSNNNVYTYEIDCNITGTLTISVAENTWQDSSGNGNTVSNTVIITVNAVELSSIEMLNLPNKTQYLIGESIDLTGVSIKANYNNGTSKIINEGYVCENDTILKNLGQVTIGLSYTENQISKSTNFVVTVGELALNIVEPNNVLEYNQIKYLLPNNNYSFSVINNATNEILDNSLIQWSSNRENVIIGTNGIAYTNDECEYGELTITAKYYEQEIVYNITTLHKIFVDTSDATLSLIRHSNNKSCNVTDGWFYINKNDVLEKTKSLMFGDEGYIQIGNLSEKITSNRFGWQLELIPTKENFDTNGIPFSLAANNEFAVSVNISISNTEPEPIEYSITAEGDILNFSTIGEYVNPVTAEWEMQYSTTGNVYFKFKVPTWDELSDEQKSRAIELMSNNNLLTGTVEVNAVQLS